MYYVTVTIFTSLPPRQKVFELPASDIDQVLDRMKYFGIGLIAGSEGKFDLRVDEISITKPRRKSVSQLKEFFK
jgi:hypothetical protein